jgi:hypothetical protein
MVIESMLLVEFIRAGVKRRGMYSVCAERLDNLCGQYNEMSRSEWLKKVQGFALEYGWEVRFPEGGATVEFLPRSRQ